MPGTDQPGKQKKNIFLTGAPSSGKTTVIKKVLSRIPCNAKGFYTEEERAGDRRVGFLMKTLDGKKGYLAHQNITSEYAIRRYGVSIPNIEAIAVPSITPEPGKIIILDEIGKMECFSEKFRQAALSILDSDCIVIGTITLGGTDFVQEVKQRDDLEIMEVTPVNRDRLPDTILTKVGKLLEIEGV
jgi:nucleoside-triphosphatase